MHTVNPQDAIDAAVEQQSTHTSKAKRAFDWFNNQSGLIPREDAVTALMDEYGWDREEANRAIGGLVGDIVDPVQQVPHPDHEKVVGIIEYKEWPSQGAYGYINYHDLHHDRKRVVCAKCVEEAEIDADVTRATEGEGSVPENAAWQVLLDRLEAHYRDSHTVRPSEVNVGASLVNGTTISGNTSFHAGNDGAGSGLNADSVEGNEPADLIQTTEEIQDAVGSGIANGDGLVYDDPNDAFSVAAGGNVSTDPDGNIEVNESDLNHDSLSGINTDSHHTRFSDEEAQDAVGAAVTDGLAYDDANNQIDVTTGTGVEIDTNGDVAALFSGGIESDGSGGFRVSGGGVAGSGLVEGTSPATLTIGQDAVGATELDQSTAFAFSAGIDNGGNRLTGVASPTNDTDAATKGFVDSRVEGLDIKDSVEVATTSGIDLSSSTNPNPVDGETLADGERVLLKDQSAGSENGIYVAQTATDPTTWVRAEDANSDADVSPGLFVFVESGTENGGQGFVLSNESDPTLGTNVLNFTRFSDSGQVSAGDGLAQSSGTISVDVSDFAGSFLSDDGAENLQANVGSGLESDGSGNFRVAGSAVAGSGLSEGGNPFEVDLTNDSVTVSANSGLTGGGTVSLGGSTSVSVGAGSFVTAGSSNVSVNIGSGLQGDGSDNIQVNAGNALGFNAGALTVQESNINHDNLSSIDSDDHHTRFSNEEAQDAVGGIVSDGLVYDDANNRIDVDAGNALTFNTGTLAVAAGGVGSSEIAADGVGQSEIGLGDGDAVLFGAGDDMGARFDATADDFRVQDETNSTDRLALDRTSGDLNISGTLTEGSTL
jgi:hypothetical protein